MAIAIDQKVSAFSFPVTPNLTLTTPLSVSPGGSDRMVTLCIVGIGPASAPTFGTPTYGGTNMTQVTSGTTTLSNTRISIWYLANPPAGTANIAVTTSVSAGYLGVIAAAWTGVHQTVPFGTYATATGTSTAVSVTVTSAADEVVVDNAYTGAAATVGAGQTTIGNIPNRQASSYEAGAASVAMTWTLSATNTWVTSGVPLKPSTATSPVITPPVVGDGGTQATGAATIAEMRITPYRAAPTGFSQQTGAAAITENNGATWEASGMFSEVVMGTIQTNGDIVWDTLYTLPSVAPSSQIEVTPLPTANSLNGSLIVTTQDGVFVYALPYVIDPVQVSHPRLAKSNATPADIVPLFYPSAVDLGTGLYELVYVTCDGEDFTYEVDKWAYSFRWDETNAWATVQTEPQPNAVFQVPGANRGSTLHTAFSILDGVNTDPIGPTGKRIVAWVREVTDRQGEIRQSVRTLPEVS